MVQAATSKTRDAFASPSGAPLAGLGRKPTGVSSRAPVLAYIDRIDKAERQRGDIDHILLSKISKRTPLERGIVGPTGASSIVNASVLGPLLATWGLVAGYRIITGARDAGAYLRLVTGEIKRLESDLKAMQVAADVVQAPATVKALTERLDVLEKFRKGVARAASAQRFNQTVPGFIQLGASVGIMGVGINSVPTLAHGGTLLSAAGTLILGTVSGGALCIYGGLSMARSMAQALYAWNRPKRDVRLSTPPQERAYLEAYNDRVGLNRLFHTLNSVSWAGFLGGCGCMIGIAAGAAISHGAVVAAVIVTALSVVVWDALWGERCAPRNALAPHIDRNHLQSVSERAELWSLLENEGQAKKQLRQDIVKALPANATGPSPPHRYEFGWKHVPMVGGAKRLARWVADASNDATDLVMLTYLTAHMDGQKDFFATKLARHTQAANKRIEELNKICGGVPPALKSCVNYDRAITAELTARSEAASALHKELHRVHRQATRKGQRPKQERINRLLASFIAVNHLENEIFSGRDVERHTSRYHAQMRPATWFAKARPAHITMAAHGMKAIERQGLTKKQRERFVHALLSDRQRQYELDALFSIEADHAISV